MRLSISSGPALLTVLALWLPGLQAHAQQPPEPPSSGASATPPAQVQDPAATQQPPQPPSSGAPATPPAQVQDPAATQSPAPAPAETPPPPAAEAAPEQAPALSAEQAPAQLALVLFDEANNPLANLKVELVGGVRGETNRDGSILLAGTPGKATLVIALPFAGAGQTHQESLELFAGETVQLLLTFAADGSVMDRDLEAPDAATVAAAQQADEQRSAPPGTLSGSVRSMADDSPVAAAKVYVLGSPVEAETDMQGTFSIQVPSGTHAVSIIHPRYSTHVERGVEVTPDTPASIQVRLEAASIELDDFVVTVPRVEGSVARVLEQRRESTAVTDALGAEDLAKSPDGSASAATRRIVGATIVNGKFLVVRGLRGRYTNVRLNGVLLPSTDPDVPGVQLDLFPSNLLENITIAKTFTADIPGDFAGGSMNIRTKAFPDELRARLSLGTTFNTASVFQDMSAYPGGGTDFLGFDDGTRQLPDAVPDARLERGSRFSEGGFSQDEINEIARDFPSNWEVEPTTAMPDINFTGSVGNTFEVAGRPLGGMFTATYKRKQRQRSIHLTKVTAQGQGEDREVVIQEELDAERGTSEVLLGGLGNLGFSPADGHELQWVGFITQNGEDNANRVSGFSEDEGTDIKLDILRYVSRRLFFNQFLGTHRDFAGELELDWQVNFDTANRDQPDTRSVAYTLGPEGFIYRAVTGSGERLYSKLDQSDVGGGLDLRHTLGNGKLAGGYMNRFSKRTFTARRFGHSFEGTTEDRKLPPNQLFAPDNQGVTVEMLEVTQPTDGYSSGEDLHGGYLSFDQEWTDWLKMNAGLRIEAFTQRIQVQSPFSGSDTEFPLTERTDTDPLGAASFVFSLSDEMSIRTAYGGTVGRPLARELAPFLTQDFTRRRNVQGNPDLQRTYIHNADLRWEFFPSTTEVLAASGFYKVFQSPIETVIQDFNGNITFENAQDAQNFGVELEARASLGHLSDALEDFSALWNLSLIHSRVTLTEEQAQKATNQQRPMAGQSPWVVNFSVGYEPGDFPLRAFIFYNVFGPRILEVGSNGLPDVVEQPFHGLDVTAFYNFDEHWTLNVSGKNLAFRPIRITQGDFNFATWDPGAEFSVKITWQN